MPDNKEIGQRIQQRRQTLGLTLEDVAVRVGVARSTIQRYESGRIQRLKQPVVEAIADVLCVSPDWLLGSTKDPSPARAKDADELVKFALFGDVDVDDAVFEEVKRFARFAQAQQKERNKP